ncbi:MAG: phenylalanyl-tRNA synthetase subunit beta [uncultured bacterium]|nr:MAG: phenylalanyl-tRNA synthetase subunit beta [uncultured bacterium]KKU25987.1 MAG: Phenylalanine-tRNA ligase beta subunit [Microgenomates group bacterium GW2011_GWA2_46_16]
MKIPLIWLKDYIETTKSGREIATSFTQLGLMLDKPIENDVLDLEQRLNRSDLLSMIGCARDLAAFEGIPLKLPKISTKPGKNIDPKDKITIDVKVNAVKRFRTRIIKGIKVKPSPSWLADGLKLYGMEPINNIVDITNFVMIEFAQTMHTQDISKLRGKDITIRWAKTGEKIITLLGTEAVLDKNDFVLTSGGEITVIGGVVGGKNTGVTNTTQDIILDSGNYDPRVIRHSSRRLKIINESVSRNDKFLDPRTIDLAISRTTDLILELAGGTVYENDDYYPCPVTPKTMTLHLSRLKLLSGMDIPLAKIKNILKSLEYAIVEESIETLTLEVPYFRTDIEVEDDLVSDILRINNYTNIPVQALSSPVPTDFTPAIYRFEERLRDLLVAQGAHEHITSSLVTSNGQSDEVVLANTLSTDQNALRTNLEPGLFKVISTYKKHKQAGITVFEIGKVFRKLGNKYLEGRVLTVMGTKDSLTSLLVNLGITQYFINHKHEILVGNQLIGTISHESYTLVTDTLMSLAINYSGIVSEFAHTQSRDLSLIVPPSLNYADIIQVINQLTLTIQSVICKSFTKLADTNNYLLTLTWPDKSDIEREQSLILSTLKKSLKIDSKS